MMPPDYTCSFSAQTTSDGNIVSGTVHEWYVDGESRGRADTRDLYIVPEGYHTIEVHGTTPGGLQSSASMVVESRTDAAGCSWP